MPAPLEERSIQLSDGRIVGPDDAVVLGDLWEVLPLLLEHMGASTPGGLAPGQQVPVAGQPGVPSVAPGAMGRPGAVGGQQGGFGVGGGRGTGFSAVGGGSRGGRGLKGDRGATGPRGPGVIVPITKTDGNFTVTSVSPFVVVPGTEITFDQSESGVVLFLIQAVFGGNTLGARSSGQLGLRVDGVDHPLTANLMLTTPVGVDQFLASVNANFPLTIASGSHTVSVVVRGDASLGAPTGNPVIVQANATIPLAFTVVHL